MKCLDCKKETKEEYTFCPHCGRRLNKAEVTETKDITEPRNDYKDIEE